MCGFVYIIIVGGFLTCFCLSCTDAALLDAEWAVLKKQKRDLRAKFEQAIVMAGRRGLTHLQALANERLAIYMEEIGDDVESLYRYKQANKLYAEWGAKAKTQQLQIKIDAMKEKGTSSTLGSVQFSVSSLTARDA
jgi:hypothetical protein